MVSGTAESAEAQISRGQQLCLEKGDRVTLTADLPRFVYAPLHAGTECGRLYVWVNGEEAARLPLCWGQDVPVTEQG